MRSVGNLIEALPFFDKVQSAGGRVNMEWLTSWNHLGATLTAEQQAALANTLNLTYQNLAERLRRNQEEFTIDLVIVAHGSIGATAQQEEVVIPGLRQESVVPSRMHFATDHLSSISFYQPWGVLIDAGANSRVVCGTIRPEQTSFRGVNQPISIPNTLPRFNVIENGSSDMIPNVWHNQINNNDSAIQELWQLIQGQTTRPMVFWNIGPMCSFIVDALASVAATMLSLGGNRIDLRIHHAHCLDWPSRTEQPPAQLVALQQYYNAVGETFMNPLFLTIS